MSTKSPRTQRRQRYNEARKILDLIRSRNSSKVPNVLFNQISVNSFVEHHFPTNSEELENDIIDSTSDIGSISTNIQKQSRNFQPLNLPDSLRVWATTHNVTHSCLRDLLGILNRHVNNILPLDPRTLLVTPRSINVQNIGGGEFVYFGIWGGISRLLHKNLTVCKFPILSKMQASTERSLLSISVGIDGVPISKSSTKSFWPILGLLDQATGSSPFIIGIFCGMAKPTDTLFLKQFVDEALKLENSGITIGSSVFDFRISCFILDAPARSFVKGCKQHNSYNSCERCVQEGEWLGRVVLRKLNCENRTDESFRSRSDPDHHTYNSDLSRLRIGFVSQFVLDHMHLVFLGVTKKLLCTWVKGRLPHRLSSNVVLQFSRQLLKLRPFIPRNFQRKPRALSELAHFKATEFRLFLLYTGIAVLSQNISPTKFKNFLKFQAAIFILLSPNASVKSWNDLARTLLIQFVQEVELIYGPEFIIYNVHSLIHICDDAMNYGNLSSVSAFPFESFMQKLKRMMHANNFHVNQVAKRLTELDSILVDSTASKDQNIIAFSNYKYDNCYCLNDGRHVLLKQLNNSTSGIFYLIDKVCKFPDYPFDSLFIGIFIANISVVIVEVSLTDIHNKCILLPYKNMYICMPLLHTMQ